MPDTSGETRPGMRGETFLIYGANGYTGSLVAEAARARGLAPILAGRRASAVGAVAARTGLESRGFHLMDPASTREAIRDVAVVANCAGPFSATSRAMTDACLATGTHYVDITGEVAVFEAARARDAEARQAGVVVCPGVGFDVIPTDCVAAVLAEALPDATHLALGFDTDSGVSKGTAKTVVEGLRTGCLVREGGRLVPVPLGSRRRRIDFGRGLRHAVVIPWGDVSTAFATTGIPNIEVYFAVPWAVSIGMRLVEPLRGWLAGHRAQAWLTARAERTVRGPGETDRGRTRTWVWGEARNAEGRIVTARVETANAYDVTVEGVLLAVTHLLADCGTSLPPQDAATADRRKPRLFGRSAKGEKVMDDFFHGQLGSTGPGGFMTPTQLLGKRCVESLPGSGRIAVETGG